MATALTIESSRKLNLVITELLVQAEALVVLLTDTGGNVITQAPELDDPELQTFAALGAGSYAATRELAALAGEKTFQSICHEGEQTSIYAAGIGSEFLLMVIFQKTTTLGLVKLYTRRAAKEMGPMLNEVSKQTVSQSTRTAFEMQATDDVFAGESADARERRLALSGSRPA
ncbi:MAG: roadblock/LC7 domain-containing protein [Verrucomicrobia bacterium]|nr:roadblock/LC7 domain-containing protein [Verrucomicrobiota bacterium]